MFYTVTISLSGYLDEIDILCCLGNYINNLIYLVYVTIIITLSVKNNVPVNNVSTAAQGP